MTRTRVVRVGTGPGHLARPARGGWRLACARTVPADRITIMGDGAWTSGVVWRRCPRCKSAALRATSDAQLFAG